MDSSEAGNGDFNIQVTCEDQVIATQCTEIGQHRYRVVFVPAVCADHVADVTFNYQKIPGINSFNSRGLRAVVIKEVSVISELL